MARTGRTILVVSDDPVTVFTACGILLSSDYRVRVLGKRGRISKLGDSPIDVLIIDAASQSEPPAMVARLRSARPGMRVLYLSRRTDDKVVRLGIVNEKTGELEKAGLLGSVEKALRPRTMTAGG